MVPVQPDLRVMVDANILIAGTVWPRWPYEVLQHALAGDFRLVLSQYIIKQALMGMNRRFLAYVDQFEQLLQASRYELAPEPTSEQIYQNKDLVRDVTDIPIALAAINAEVNYLVSEDKDLTVQNQSTQQLRERLQAVISGTFLREAMGWTSQDLEKVRGRTWRDL